MTDTVAEPQTTRADAIQGLRDFADFLEANEDASLPSGLYALDYQWGKENLLARTRELGGLWNKKEDGAYFSLVRHFGPVRYEVYTTRSEVCERVVTGTRTVTREEYDPDALAQVPKRTVTAEEEIVEWRCPPSLLAD